MYQQSSGEPLFGLFMLLFLAAYYLYFSFAQFKIAQKLGTPNAFFAFIPILQHWQLVTMAGKSVKWFVWSLVVPPLYVVLGAILWMEVARIMRKSPALGILNIFPFINLFTISLMAFSSASAQPESPFPPHQKEQPRQPMNVGS